MVTYGLCSCGENEREIPLEGVHVEAKVVDMVAQVSVAQYYYQRSNSALNCSYIFPLDSFSAVCGFQAEINGNIIDGCVKEKSTARKEFTEAVERGDGAYLLEEEKGDVFKVYLGNIPPQTRVNIFITYITELKIEPNGSTRFLLPTTVAPRYTPPSSSSAEISWKTPWFDIFSHKFSYLNRYFIENGINGSKNPYPLSVILEIESPNSEIVSIKSNTHDIHVKQLNEKISIVSLFVGEFTGIDFVVDYHIKDFHQPRSIIEIDEEKQETTAMITFVPDFTLNDVKTELIFLIDRSGSMAGPYINAAKSALQLFLRSLPVDCYFNIIGFGSSFVRLFRESKKLTEESFEEAKKHVDGIRASLMGTEILPPLHDIFESDLIENYQRNIFILTDGQVSNSAEVFKLIEKNNEKSRVFSLGIGGEVSHDLVEGMARAGRGNAQFIIDEKEIEEVVVKQLKDAIQPALSNISIDWNSFVLKSHGDFDDIFSLCSQTPFKIPPIFSGHRFIIYAFLKYDLKLNSTKENAKENSGEEKNNLFISLSANSPDGLLSLEIPVEFHHGNIVQKLAAKSMIRDLQSNSSYLHCDDYQKYHSISNDNINEISKKEILNLSLNYQLLSKYSSFIAIEPRYYIQPRNYIQQNRHQNHQQNRQIYAQNYQNVSNCSSSNSYNYQNYNLELCRDVMISNIDQLLSRGEKLECLDEQCEILESKANSFKRAAAAPSLFSNVSNWFSSLFTRNNNNNGNNNNNNINNNNINNNNNNNIHKESISICNKNLEYSVTDEELEIECKEILMECDEKKSENRKTKLETKNVETTSANRKRVINNTDEILKSVVRLQKFNGSFELNNELAGLITFKSKNENDLLNDIPDILSSMIPNRESIWATVLVVAFLNLYLEDSKSKWELMILKSSKWVETNCASSSSLLDLAVKYCESI